MPLKDFSQRDILLQMLKKPSTSIKVINADPIAMTGAIANAGMS